MNGYHWLTIAVVLVVGYFIGANYKFGLPVIG